MKEGKWPKNWTHAVFVPFHKKGSMKKCNSYTTIALISHASKIMLRIINNRLKKFLHAEIPQEQTGFMPGKGTREKILKMRLIFNKPIFLCFLDYAKAFDNVKWDRLYSVLEKM